MAYITKKMEREMRGPGLMEIVLGVVFSLILGVLLAAVHLVMKPAEKRSEKDLAKDAPATSLLYPPVYFTEGSSDRTKGATWKTKQQAFTSGAPGEIVLTEEELNAFIAAAVPPPPAAPPAPTAPKPAAKPEDAKAVPTFVAATLPPGVINFRVREGVLQAAFNGQFSVLGIPLSPLVQMRGNFAKGGEGYEFQPAELYLGSLPLHKFPGLAGWLMNKEIAAQQGVPEDLKTAWKALGNITVEGNTLKLSRQ